MQGVQGNENILIGGDMNEHVGCDRIDYDRVHGGYRYGKGMRLERKYLTLHQRIN